MRSSHGFAGKRREPCDESPKPTMAPTLGGMLTFRRNVASPQPPVAKTLGPHNQVSPTFGIVVDAVLVVMGLLWCRAVFARWRSDVDELRSSADFRDRVVIIFFWAVTGVIVLLLANFFVGLLKRVGLV